MTVRAKVKGKQDIGNIIYETKQYSFSAVSQELFITTTVTIIQFLAMVVALIFYFCRERKISLICIFGNIEASILVIFKY
jgi:hypothetical protein